jgi:hypothetical protein
VAGIHILQGEVKFEISYFRSPETQRRSRLLIDKGAAKSLIWLKGQIPKVEAEPSIEKDGCSQIIDSGILAYGGKQGLRFETPGAWITK